MTHHDTFCYGCQEAHRRAEDRTWKRVAWIVGGLAFAAAAVAIAAIVVLKEGWPR